MSDHSSFRTPAGGVAVLGSVVFGAVVGGAVAAAESIPKVRAGQMDRREAAMAVAREAGATGAATGAAVAVVGALGLGGFLSLAGIVVVATGTKYLLDAALRPAPAVAASSAVGEPEPAAEPASTASKAPPARKKTAKPAAKKTAKSAAKAKPEGAKKAKLSIQADAAPVVVDSEEIQ
jgi:hypothetical protein